MTVEMPKTFLFFAKIEAEILAEIAEEQGREEVKQAILTNIEEQR